MANIEDFGYSHHSKNIFVPVLVGLYLQPVKLFYMGIWQQVQEYLYLKKRDPNAPNSQWIKYMHGINRFTILIFLLGIIVIIVKMIFLKKH